MLDARFLGSCGIVEVWALAGRAVLTAEDPETVALVVAAVALLFYDVRAGTRFSKVFDRCCSLGRVCGPTTIKSRRVVDIVLTRELS